MASESFANVNKGHRPYNIRTQLTLRILPTDVFHNQGSHFGLVSCLNTLSVSYISFVLARISSLLGLQNGFYVCVLLLDGQ